MAITEDYIPLVPPLQVSAEMRQYIDIELRRIADRINARELYAPPLAEEPSRPEDGVIVYANGTDWNPGSGEGFYGYENGSWVKL